MLGLSRKYDHRMPAWATAAMSLALLFSEQLEFKPDVGAVRAMPATDKKEESATRAAELASELAGRARTRPPAAAHGRPPPSVERRVDKGVATRLKTVRLQNQNGNCG